MTVRVVPLHSSAASDSHVGGTAADRVAPVIQLSESLWIRTRLPVPTCTRTTIPVAVRPHPTRLDDQQVPAREKLAGANNGGAGALVAPVRRP